MTILAAFVLGAAAMWGVLWFIEWLFFAPIEPEREPHDLGPDGYGHPYGP